MQPDLCDLWQLVAVETEQKSFTLPNRLRGRILIGKAISLSQHCQSHRSALLFSLLETKPGHHDNQ